MKVIVTEACGRCKRTAPHVVDLSEAAAIEEKQTKLDKVCKDIEEQFAKAPSADMPDLVVYFKGRMYITQRICDAFCVDTVQGAINNVLFRPIDPTTRKPREKKDPSEKIPHSAVKNKKGSKAATSTE